MAEYFASVLEQPLYGAVEIASNRKEAVSSFKENEVSMVFSDVNFLENIRGL